MPNIDLLQERVLTLVEEFRRLKEENQALSREVVQLQRENEALKVDKNLHQGSQTRLLQLENLNRKNEKDRKTIRAKVRMLLSNLEKFDPAWCRKKYSAQSVSFDNLINRTEWNWKMTNRKKIQIYGKTYNLKSSSPEVDAEEVASYVDSRMKELANALSKTSTLDLAILTALNIAQELMELKKQAETRGDADDEKLQQLIGVLDKELQDVEK